MNAVFCEILVFQGNWGINYLLQIWHCILQKKWFLIFKLHYITQIKKKIKLVTKNKESEQKHAKLICNTWIIYLKKKQTNIRLPLPLFISSWIHNTPGKHHMYMRSICISYLVVQHQHTIVVRFNKYNLLQNFKSIYLFFYFIIIIPPATKL